MADVKWIKLAVDMFDNRKIRQIETLPDGDGIIVIWVKLLCLAGITNDGGLVYFTRDIPYTEQMLANYFQRPIALVQMALRVFQQFGMIDLVDDIIMVSGWEKYQSLDRLERIQAQNRERQRRFKEQKRKDALPVTLPGNPEDNASDKEEDIDRDIEYKAQASTSQEGKTPKSSKPKSEIKHKYGEYGWVQLSDEQYGSLLRDLGQVELDRCIFYIDESAPVQRQQEPLEGLEPCDPAMPPGGLGPEETELWTSPGTEAAGRGKSVCRYAPADASGGPAGCDWYL